METNIIVNKVDLYHALRRVKPFASRDSTLPLLNAVHFFTRDGDVFVETTDRYRMLIRRVTFSMDDQEAPDGLDIVVAMSDVTTLIGLLKPTRGEPDSNVTIAVEEGPDSAHRVIKFDLQWGGSARFLEQGGEYPPLGKLVPRELDYNVPTPLVVNAPFLKDLYYPGAESKHVVMGRGGKSGSILVFSTDPDLEVGMLMHVTNEKWAEQFPESLGLWSGITAERPARV